MLESNVGRIAVIGGAGFLGEKLCGILSAARRDFSNFDINDADPSIEKIDVVERGTMSCLQGHDVIINLAAEHRDDVKPLSRYDEVNVLGAENICDAARQYDIRRIIFVSSVAIYGFSDEELVEDSPPNYFNDYGRTKFEAERIFNAWFEEDPENRMLFVVRPTVIFGENNRGNVYNLFRQIATNRFLMFGDGENIKSIAYVDNVAAFIAKACTYTNGYFVHNYADKPDLTMNELVSYTRWVLFGKKNVGLRLPDSVGYAVGRIADIFARTLKLSLPVSRVRVDKFLANTRVGFKDQDKEFTPPVELEEAILRTLRHEFSDRSKK